MTDLFDNTSNVETPTPEEKKAPDLIDVFADKLLAIKKEDGTPKYDTLEKALDALAASQQHIPRLENENKELKEKAAKADQLEELVRRMTEGNDNNSGKPNGNNPPVGGLSEDDAANLVRKILQEDRAVDAAKTNVLNVQNKLLEKYGDKAGEVLKDKAKELNTTLDDLKRLSATNPALVLSLFGNSNPATPSATTSSINSGALKAPPTNLVRPEKSLLSGPGASDRARAEFMRKVREDVNKRLNVET